MEKYSNEFICFILERMQKDIEEINERGGKFGGRIRMLEIWRGVLTGGLMILSGVVIPLVAYIFINQ